jgi:hypothetical protein
VRNRTEAAVTGLQAKLPRRSGDLGRVVPAIGFAAAVLLAGC